MQMAEPTCLMRSLSQPSESSRDFNEGDSARCLGESISFGRYMSEPLAWEKWSAFSSNRYLEEAEKSSKPGSVAKMKAYFEAYYKSIGSRKRAAKAEDATEASHFDVKAVAPHSSCSAPTTPRESDPASEDCNFEECRIIEDTGCVAPVVTFDRCAQVEVQCSEDLEGCAKVELEKPSDELENAAVQLERQPSNVLEQFKCAPGVETFKEGDDLDMLHSKVKSGNSNIGRSANTSNPPISLEMESSKNLDNQERLSSKTKKLPCSKSRIPPYCKPPPISFGRAVASHSTKEGCVTPSNKRQAKDISHLKTLPFTSVHKSNNFGPRADVIRKSSRIIQKSLIENPLTPSAKVMRGKATPMQTPNRASVVGKLKQTPATPQTKVGRSISTPGRSLSRGRVGGPEFPPLSLNSVKPSSSCGFKERASITFLPFNFRTEERAAKRREFFTKQQEKEAEKTQQLEKTKQEQANTTRKLLHTIGLKAKSSVDRNIKSSRQETCVPPQPRPLKKGDPIKLKDRKNDLRCYQSKIRHENASPNII